MKYSQVDIDAVSKQISTLNHQSMQARYTFLEELELDQPDAELILILLVDDRAWNVRARALELLSNFNSVLARIAVKSALSDQQWLVRVSAIEALGVMGNTRDVHYLSVSLADQAWQVRSSAAISYGMIGGNLAYKALTDALASEVEPIVRRDIAFALSEYGEKAILPLEEALRRENNDSARLGLIYSLYKVGKRDQSKIFLDYLTNPDDSIRHQAVNAIDLSIVPQEDLPNLIAAIQRVSESDNNIGIRKDAELLLKK